MLSVSYLENSYSETELVKDLIQRKSKAFSYLYDHYAGALLKSISATIKDINKAGDILQKVFVKIWGKIHTYDCSKSRLFTWMLNIAKNVTTDVLRSKANRIHKLTVECNNINCKTEINPYNQIEALDIRKAITQLTPHHKNLIELSYFYGYKLQEISDFLKIPLGTIKSRKIKACLELKSLLATG
jgi:RNA polymerase sigma-70 factor (ECF subfamily)